MIIIIKYHVLFILLKYHLIINIFNIIKYVLIKILKYY